jgi:hypothetical protein
VFPDWPFMTQSQVITARVDTWEDPQPWRFMLPRWVGGWEGPTQVADILTCERARFKRSGITRKAWHAQKHEVAAKSKQ